MRVIVDDSAIFSFRERLDEMSQIQSLLTFVTHIPHSESAI